MPDDDDPAPVAHHPDDAVGTVDEVVNMIAFLCSDLSSYTTGTVETPTGRNAPNSAEGLWDFGSFAPGEQKARLAQLLDAERERGS